MFNRQKIGLQDCRVHGGSTRAELFIVEGISASQAVCNLRDPEFQAVLPMQGKPANASKASARMLRENVLFRELRSALGVSSTDGAQAAECRYSRIILLFDPDADGIHIGALMLIYFNHQLCSFVEAGRIAVVRAPLYELTYRQTASDSAPWLTRFAYTDDEFKLRQHQLTLSGAINLKTKRIRGLAGMPTDTLRSTCIAPETRHLFQLGIEDAEAAVAAFGGLSR